MKKFFLTTFLISSALLLNAQDNSKAKTILDGVSKQTKSYTTIDIAFTFTIENSAKKSKDTKTGYACMKAEKYWLSYSGQEVFCDGQTVWTYIKENNEVQINVNDPNSVDELNPLKLLTDYDKTFTPKFIKEETHGSKIIQILDLTPIKAKSFYKVRLEIDKAQKQVVNATIYDKNGITVYTYAITQFITNKTIADTKFTFKSADHPGVEVIDLR